VRANSHASTTGCIGDCNSGCNSDRNAYTNEHADINADDYTFADKYAYRNKYADANAYIYSDYYANCNTNANPKVRPSIQGNISWIRWQYEEGRDNRDYPRPDWFGKGACATLNYRWWWKSS
jgi:hypothetical protein